MLVYRPEQRGRHTLFVAPGSQFPVSDWLDDSGKPRQFAVVFENGRAKVEAKLGQYLVQQGLAQKTSLILPSRGVA